MADDSQEGAGDSRAAKEKPSKSRKARAPRGSKTTRSPRGRRGASGALVTGELPLGEPPSEQDRDRPVRETESPPPETAVERRDESPRPDERERREAPPVVSREPERESRDIEPEAPSFEDRAAGETVFRSDDPAPSEPPQAEREVEHAPSGAAEERSQDDRGASGHDESREGQHQGGGGGGGQHGFRGDFGFRKKFKKDKHKGKFFQPGQQGGGQGGQGQRQPHWKQPAPLSDSSPLGSLPDPAKFLNLDELAARAASIADEGEALFLDEVARATHHELVAALRQRGIPVSGNPGRQQMIGDLFKWATENRRPIIDRGLLDLAAEGHGFVVHGSSNYRLLPDSTFLPASFIRKYGLKRGHELEVQVAAPSEGERCPAALVVRSVMGGAPEEISKVVPFEDLVPYYPTNRIFLEVGSTDAPTKVDVSMRCVDILTPIGFGQRGLIVAPPRTGKTILLQGLANSIATNHPQARLIVLLVDERPEEVTDFRRNVKGEVVSSTFDESPESHVHAAEMVSEKAKRLVERGEHVVILLDSITRLGRAYNALASNSGKIMSGGLEATALQKPKRFFGAARNIEGGGSLTVMGTALIDTNSRMDDIIFEEFKGTGNMELHLDRDLVNKRIFPAINFERSGTRKEELLYHPDELQKIYGLRRIMLGVPAFEAMEMLIQRLKKTRSNAEFLLSLSAR